MANTQKTAPKRAPAKTAQSSKKKAPPAPPVKSAATLMWQRIAGGVGCFLLAMFLLLNLFGVEALLIDLLSYTLRGLVGYGFFVAIPALLLAAYLLLFRPQQKKVLRLLSVFLFPLLFAALLHVVLDSGLYSLSLSGLEKLWTDGRALGCGGALGGFLAVLFAQLFSGIGAGVIFFCILLLLACAALHITPETILVAVREWREDYRERRAYRDEWEDDYDYGKEDYGSGNDYKQGDELASHTSAGRGEKATGRRRAADLPLDEPPLLPKQQEKEPEAVEPLDGLFAKKPRKAREEASVAPPQPVSVTAEPVLLPEVPEREMSKTERREMLREQSAEVARDVQSSFEVDDKQAYEYPSLDLLHDFPMPPQGAVQEELSAISNRLSETISSFGVVARISGAVRGPSITRYELPLEQGTRLNKLTNLADDIALALGVASVRIAPVPGKSSLVGIEVPNKTITPVPIREVIEAKNFLENSSKVSFSVGKDIGGNYIVGDIAKLPHLLIAGTTGSGKSVCTNSLIISLLYKATPDEVRLIMIDPKMVELGIYNGIPHLLIPVVTDPKKAAGALQWAVVEMMKRYRMFSEAGVRDLASYNAYALREGMPKLPQIVVVIDELADLMLVAAKEVEESICRVAQMGRASGMHLIIATQRPSADVITGLMKANIPSRIAFAVASALESRIILDTQGAEKLVGKGDMLWYPLGSGKPLRVQGCLIGDQDVAAVVAYVKRGSEPVYDESILEEIELRAKENGKSGKSSASAAGDAYNEDDAGEYDEHFDKAVEIVLELGQASVSMLQRRLKLGYSRAARLVDQMEERGVVGPFEGSKPRQLLMSREKWDELHGREPQEAPPAPYLLPEDAETEEAADFGELPPWNEEDI